MPMSREKNKTHRPIEIGLVSDRARPRLKSSNLIENMSGLVSEKEISKICEFIKNPDNGEQERLNVIRILQRATLIPTTYEILQTTLQRLCKYESSAVIKTAAQETFSTQRDKQTLFVFKKVI